MAKKAKKSNKKGEKEKKEPILRPVTPPIDEASKKFYLKQIKDLEEKISRYQERCDELKIKADRHEQAYDQIEKDKREIVSFLKKTLEQRQDEIADLQERMTALQQAKDQEKETFETQITQLKREFQEMRDQLTGENIFLSGKLAALEEFKTKKEEMEKHLEDLENQLLEQEENHKQILYNLERKAVVDKDRLKKEMILRVNEVAAEFRKVSNKQMSETTKRNIRENLSLNMQLGKMSEKTRDLIQENDTLKETEKELKIQIQILEATQKDIAKKNNGNLKVLKMITSKAREQEIVIDELETREGNLSQLKEENDKTRNEFNQLQHKFEKISLELKTTQEKLNETKSQRDIALQTEENIRTILAATAHTLKQTISSQPSQESEILNNRATMIERMLQILQNASIAENGPIPSDFLTEKQKTLMAVLTTKPKPEETNTSKLETDKKKVSHYQLGDLGLVPRPQLDMKSLTKNTNLTRIYDITKMKEKHKIRLNDLSNISNKNNVILPPISPDTTAT